MNEFVVTIRDKKKKVRILKENKVEMDGKVLDVNLSKVSDYLYLLRIGNNVYEVTTNKLNDSTYRFYVDGQYFEPTVRTTLQEKANELLKKKALLTSHNEIKAPMPGLILKIKKDIGQEVEMGESLIVLEAMKMENEIRSPASGTIKEILFNEGESVEKDKVIIKIE